MPAAVPPQPMGVPPNALLPGVPANPLTAAGVDQAALMVGPTFLFHAMPHMHAHMFMQLQQMQQAAQPQGQQKQQGSHQSGKRPRTGPRGPRTGPRGRRTGPWGPRTGFLGQRGFLFEDLDSVIISFLPLDHFPVSAAVCKCWAKLTRCQKKLNQMAAEELLTEALLSMKRGDCPSHTSQLLNRALALFPRKAEASYWHAMLLEQMCEDKQALECLKQALALRPTRSWRRKLMAMKLGVLGQKAESRARLYGCCGGPGNSFDLRMMFHLGCDSLRDGEYEEAVTTFTSALRSDYPQAYALLIIRAKAHLGQGETELAQLDMDHALQICPTFALPFTVNMNNQLGNHGQANRMAIEHAGFAKEKVRVFSCLLPQPAESG